ISLILLAHCPLYVVFLYAEYSDYMWNSVYEFNGQGPSRAPECSVGRKADMDLGESMIFRPEVSCYHVFSIVCIRSTEKEEEDPPPFTIHVMRFNITLPFIFIFLSIVSSQTNKKEF
ncbi:hypothetical protein VIGAN_04373200, partial [Vigna angularis var. angularis]